MHNMDTKTLRWLLNERYIVITSNEQYETVRELAMTGLAGFGFHFGNMESEGKLTKLGRFFVKKYLERIDKESLPVA